jgi:hypothetical protein
VKFVIAKAAAAAVVIAALLPAQAALAVAPGCTSALPTAIGGGIYGYPDNRSLHALVGVDLVAGSTHVKVDGTANTSGGYAYNDNVNPTLGADGSTDTTSYERVWGANGSAAYQCVAANVTQVFLEVYPKDTSGTTDKVRYGEAAHYYQPITSGVTNTIDLRLPLRYELGGNTGYVNGYITYNGRPVPDPNVPGDPNHIAPVRVWPAVGTTGPQCGVEGFSASADSLGLGGAGTSTFYRVDALAGPRCGAATQDYRLDVTCVCGGTSVTLSRNISITTGNGIRVDLGF